MRKYAVINECGDERCGRLEEMRDGALVSFQTVQELAEACLHAVGYCCANNVQLDGPPLTMVRAKLLEIVGRSAPETRPAPSPPPLITGASARHDGNCPCWDCTRDQFGI